MSSETDLIICKKLRDVAWPGNDWAVPSAYAHEAADLIDEMYEALATAIDLVERDVIRVRPSEREELLAALEAWNSALSKARGES